MKTFLGAFQGRLIRTLIVISLVLGIAIEIMSIVTTYYGMIIRKSEYLQAEGKMRPTSDILGGKKPSALGPLSRAELKAIIKTSMPSLSEQEIQRHVINICSKREKTDKPCDD
jgi:hypothetical protein